MTCLARRLVFVITIVIAVSVVLPSTAFAQGLLPDAPEPSIEFAPVAANPIAPTPAGDHFGEHHFWDTQNIALFSAVGASSGADFAVTRSNLQSGGRELNPVVRLFGRSTAGLAVNFCGETVGVIGVSYLFHKTGHHRLERLASMVNIGVSAGAVSFGLTHR